MRHRQQGQSQRWPYWVVILIERNKQVGSFYKRLRRHYKRGDTLKVTLYIRQERRLNGLYIVVKTDEKTDEKTGEKNHLLIARRKRDRSGRD